MNKPRIETYSARMRRIYQRFMEERERLGIADQPVNLNDVYDFARKNEAWYEPRIDPRARFRKDMARALREDHFTDNKGRTVRRYHARKLVCVDEFGVCVQQVLWADMLTEPPPPRTHMEVSFKQRRAQIVGDCHQLKNDVDHYNDICPGKAPIKTLWNFTDDMDDLDQPTEYTARPMEDLEEPTDEEE
jgi:hypothetical protein